MKDLLDLKDLTINNIASIKRLRGDMARKGHMAGAGRERERGRGGEGERLANASAALE